MKKLFSVLLALSILFCAGCGTTYTYEEQTNYPNQTTEHAIEVIQETLLTQRGPRVSSAITNAYAFSVCHKRNPFVPFGTYKVIYNDITSIQINESIKKGNSQTVKIYAEDDLLCTLWVPGRQRAEDFVKACFFLKHQKSEYIPFADTSKPATEVDVNVHVRTK